MKKFVIPLIMFLMIFSLFSCADNSGNPGDSAAESTENIIETLAPRGGENLSESEEKAIAEIIENKEWADAGAEIDTENAHTIEVNEKTYLYDPDKNIITNAQNSSHMILHDEEQFVIDRIVQGEEAVDEQAAVKTESGGVTLNIEISPELPKAGENFVLAATVTNNTGKEIYVPLPSGTDGMHFEVNVEIVGEGGFNFTDLDTFGKFYTEENRILAIKDGESYTQLMNIAPGYYSEDGYEALFPDNAELVYYSAGTYRGTAVFTWSDEINSGKINAVETDFEITLR